MSRDKSRRTWEHRSRLYLWLGEYHVQLGRLQSGRKLHWEVLAQAEVAWPETGHASTSTLYDALHDVLRVLEGKAHEYTLPGQELRVVVADMWVGMANIPWGSPMAHRTSARAFVIEGFKAAGIDVDALDEVRIDDAPYGSARLAIAYPAFLLTQIDQLAGRLALRCVAVRPVSVLVWDVLSGHGSLEAAAVLSDEQVTLAVGASKQRWSRPRLLDVRVEPHSGHQRSSQDQSVDSQSLQLIWQRWSLRHPLARNIQAVQVLDAMSIQKATPPMASPFVQASEPWYRLNNNPHWLNRFSNTLALDAMTTPTSRRWWHWALLGVVVSVAVALLIQAANLAFKAQDILSQLAVQNTPQSPSQTPLWTQDELKKVASVNAAIRQLNIPFEAVLQALRPPRDIRVAVVAVETASESVERTHNTNNTIKITAEAPSSEDMTRYVAFVAERKPFVRAYLIRHEIPDAERVRYRFMVEAQWTD